jgi:signal transduction histidine kinase
MNRISTNTAGERWFQWVGGFWLSIIASLFVLGAIQIANDEPSVLHSWNGLLTLVLLVANAGWFVYMMWIRAAHRHRHARPPDPRRAYSLVLLGVALTVSLVLLHSEMIGLIFADIGVIAFAIDGWTSIVPVALLGLLFLYEIGLPRSATTSAAAGAIVSLLSTVAIVYTLTAVMRQRVQRDWLIGELREAHAQLQEAHQQVQLAHAHEIELAALRERNRLAREMHDSLGHALVLIAIKIEAAQRLQAVDPERAAAQWEETKALVRSTLADLRNSLAGLRLPALEEQPFREALIELGSDLQRTAQVEVTTEVPEAADMLDRPSQEILYRVVQEALANVAKHARAHHASIQLALRDGAALLEVTDDGIGLAAAPRSSKGHYGITGMRERVDALGGTFTVGPRDGGGTVVRANVPLKERVDARYPHPVG